ncbi:antitoxin VbhA family protein [Burkholderia gladioli]|uniref:antitoxin VbhA family protein n=1 Tax=Burkholderia gladioli TaxID=28095 RepID=UPI00163E763A|nr:antitoxin VbhA family protein [Burkholderia gladioli]
MKPAEQDNPNSCAKKKIDVLQINADERARRADAVRRGFANTELEGYVISQETKELAQRFMEGEITLEEFLGA